ncbi:hypothetical protein GCM10009020_28950 [Natronoarchaeum mannanilyticum]|uniref:Uncharacterized protein n=1 Tax=Natronoarchaeum mannanilyticum TaxID=926360 RepID=A0AAV3TD16_9EURY
MSTSVPRSVRMESQRADPNTRFNAGQRRAIREAICYCRTVGAQLADYGRLLDRIEDELVLTKRDRHQLQAVLNRYGQEYLTSEERRINSWTKSVLWDAHRP